MEKRIRLFLIDDALIFSEALKGLEITVDYRYETDSSRALAALQENSMEKISGRPGNLVVTIFLQKQTVSGNSN